MKSQERAKLHKYLDQILDCKPPVTARRRDFVVILIRQVATMTTGQVSKALVARSERKAVTR